jgi:hypothetical protein
LQYVIHISQIAIVGKWRISTCLSVGCTMTRCFDQGSHEAIKPLGRRRALIVGRSRGRAASAARRLFFDSAWSQESSSDDEHLGAGMPSCATCGRTRSPSSSWSIVLKRDTASPRKTGYAERRVHFATLVIWPHPAMPSVLPSQGRPKRPTA